MSLRTGRLRADPGPGSTMSAKPEPRAGVKLIAVLVPLRLPSMSNLRLHWAAKARRVKAQRAATILALKGARAGDALDAWAMAGGLASPKARWGVTLVRIAPRKLDDDNLRGAFKAVRDAVAAYLGVDDGSDAVVWRYGQEKGPYAVRIEFRMEET